MTLGRADVRLLPRHPASKLLAVSKRAGLPRQLRRDLVGYLFIAPWLVGFLCFTLGPFLASIFLSFTRYDIVSPPKWVGLGNYGMLLSDAVFWHSLGLTLRYA